MLKPHVSLAGSKESDFTGMANSAGPAAVVDAGQAQPEGVPLVVGLFLVLDQAIVAATGGGEREVIAVVLPVEGIGGPRARGRRSRPLSWSRCIESARTAARPAESWERTAT